MILLNFGHPVTPDQRVQIESLTAHPIARVIDLPPQFDHALPFPAQVEALADAVGLTPEEVIADITGGLKPLTAGMALAALTMLSTTGVVKLEYVQSDYDEAGQRIEGSEHLVMADVSFYVTRES